MLCPRCRLPLRQVDYEGVPCDMCDACWGFWLDTGELEAVLATDEVSFSKEEAKAILDVKSASKKGPTAPAPCPRCSRTMRRVHCDTVVHLVVDRCDEHGVWLDTGEIKKVEAMAMQSKDFHTLLLRKFGLIPQS